jgi:hypothetical protein
MKEFHSYQTSLTAIGLWSITILLVSCNDHTRNISSKSSKPSNITSPAETGNNVAGYDDYKTFMTSDFRGDDGLPSLIASAGKGYPEARAILSEWILRGAVAKDKFKEFGETSELAAKTLLEGIQPLSDSNKYELAKLLLTGSPAIKDEHRGRILLTETAENGYTRAWSDLGEMALTGQPIPEFLEAHYWLLLEAHVVSPNSLRGEQIWDGLKKCQEKLSKEALSDSWAKVDEYFRTYHPLDPKPFLEGVTADAAVETAKNAANVKLDAYRIECTGKANN